MIVCQCLAVCEKRLRETIAKGASTVEEVGRACGAGTDCGSCQDQIELLIESHQDGAGHLSLLDLIRRKKAA